MLGLQNGFLGLQPDFVEDLSFVQIYQRISQEQNDGVNWKQTIQQTQTGRP
jgi:hypothetical protein